MSRDKQNIKTTDWLIRGIPEEQLKREKREAVLSAYLQLCMTYDEETKDIDFDATAEKMVAEGYVKSTDLAEEIFAEIKHIGGCSDGVRLNWWDIAELEKKYKEEGK
jgi:hypothetical protein